MAYEAKTKPTDLDPATWIASVEDERRRGDGNVLMALMEVLSGETAVMWGDGIVGFGRYTYRYASGHSGEWFRIGFALRKSAISLYLMDGCLSYSRDETTDGLLTRLGPHKMGKGCLYVKRLSDIDTTVLRELLERSWANTAMGETH